MTWTRPVPWSRPPTQAELFLYPGKEHLFADSSLPGYDEAAAKLLTSRTLAFLDPIR